MSFFKIYGAGTPLSNINGSLVNVDNSHSPATFGSNEISGLPGLAGAKSNIDAAAGIVPGICLFKGGAKKLKRKIKNITKQYKKMKGGSRKIKRFKKHLRKSMLSRQLSRGIGGGRRTRRHRRTRKQSGGYSQYQNNLPNTPNYQVAGVTLPAGQLGEANPPPITRIGGECIDNYNAYTNLGSPSRGH